MEELTRAVRRMVLDAGFDAVGITSAAMPDKAELLNVWLDAGRHGEMAWMARHRAIRLDIRKLFPGAKSVISVAQNYDTPHRHGSDPQTGKISRYAWGRDYHRILPPKLKRILADLQRLDPGIAGRVCVDTAPFLDKLWAEKAGIGWQGKHTNLITRSHGSWVFLGALIINRELCYDAPAADRCGSCTACITACPTGAIIAPYQLDARRCIAYLTIELRGRDIPARYGPLLDNYIFGCDICQDVCPWNRFRQPSHSTDFQPRPGNLNPVLGELAEITEDEFNRRFSGTPLKRTGWRKLRATAAAIQKTRKRGTCGA